MYNDFSEDNDAEQNDCLLSKEQIKQIDEKILGECDLFIRTGIDDKHRASVLSAAARLDVALERILKKIMRPCSKKEDDLFDNEKPLGTFSAKIKLAYRLKVIDDNQERALQMARKIRNEFAHSENLLNLSSSPCKDWVREFVKAVKKDIDKFDRMAKDLEKDLEKEKYPPDLVDFTLAVMILLLQLGRLEAQIVELKPIKTVKLQIDWD